jgi:tetratricopeptide (TPR) repeat protein
MKKNNLFGGPEKKPGKVDPKVTRIDKLLADPLKNHADIVELSYKIDPADRYRVRTALKDAVLANNPDPERRAAALDLASEGAADAGRWDEAIRLLEEADRVEGPKSYKWAAIGRAALAAGAFDASIRAFAKVSASGFIAEARAGAVVAQSRLGKVKRADIQRAERSVASEIDELEKSIAKDVAAEGKPGITDINELAGVLGLRAALEHVAGKKEKARETLRQARKRCGIYFDMREVALAAGLRASDAK